jgi:hypothetical protein
MKEDTVNNKNIRENSVNEKSPQTVLIKNKENLENEEDHNLIKTSM